MPGVPYSKLFRFKRKEDQEKIREYDRSKIEIERLMVFKTEMTAAHSALKKQNEELQRVCT